MKVSRSLASRLFLSDVSVGDCFEREGKIWEVAHIVPNVKKGKEKAQSRIAVRDVVAGGAPKEIRIKGGEKVELLDLGVRNGRIRSVNFRQNSVEVTFDDDGSETTAPVTNTRILPYLMPGARALLKCIEEKPLALIPPDHVLVKVTEVPPAAERATDSKRMAVLENGRKVKVPGHVEVGTWLVVRPEDDGYVRVASEADFADEKLAIEGVTGPTNEEK